MATPLDALEVLGNLDVMITPTLRHLEIYTRRGLLTLLWHEPAGPVADLGGNPHGVVLCGGAMGGLLGPGSGLYHRLGEHLSAQGIPVIRVSYRQPNDIDACTIDVAACVQLLVGTGTEQVVLMGHSFGGAVAIRAAVGLPAFVLGVTTFATQSAGCEVAGGLAGRPLLLFHGERDEILPPESSEMVRALAGTGDLVRLPGDGHLLARSEGIIWEHLVPWLGQVIGRPLAG